MKKQIGFHIRFVGLPAYIYLEKEELLNDYYRFWHMQLKTDPDFKMTMRDFIRLRIASMLSEGLYNDIIRDGKRKRTQQ